MGKPYGMTAMLQIIVPTNQQDQIWDAVESSILAGMTPDQFIAEARDCWAEVRRQQAIDDDTVFADHSK